MGVLRRIEIMPLFLAMTLIIGTALGVATWFRMSRINEAAEAAAAQQPRSTAYSQAPMERPLRPAALFVGDDFTVGDEGYYTYPNVACNLLAMICNVDAQSGTGFVNNGQDYSKKYSRLIDRLPQDGRIFNANLVIIDAGRNDNGVAPEAYGQAMEEYLGEVARLWPSAKIVVIAPSLLSAGPYPDYSKLISIIRQKSQLLGAVLIDPIAEGWYDDVDISTIESDDHLHPNQEGHLLMGRKLTESLERDLGIQRSATI